VESRRVPYAVLHDPTGVAATSYRVRAYPTAYLIDRRGKVVWAGNPLRKPSAVEDAIEEALGGA
jgi:hypothetical protein